MSAYINAGRKGVAVVGAVVIEHSPPTNLAKASSPGVDAICGLALFLVLSFARRVFFSGFPVFFPPPTISFSLGRK